MYQDNSWYTTESVKIPIPIIHYVPMYVYYGIAHFGKTNAFNTVITSTQSFIQNYFRINMISEKWLLHENIITYKF